MFGRFEKKDPTILDGPIERVLSEMETYGPDSEEYPSYLSYLERLFRLKTETRRERISRDTLALVAGNLAGILIIVIYEQKHVMASKGLSFIRPLK